MRLYILWIALILLALPIVFGEPDFYYKANADISLKIPCYTSNNLVCASSVICTITVNYPNGANLINNATMTNSVTYYSYTLQGENITIFGIYNGFMNCDDPSGDNGFEEFSFEVNTAGKKIDSIGSIPLMAFMLFITIGLFALLKLVDRFSEDDIMELVFRGCIILFGLFMTTITISMIITIASDMGLGVNSELFTVLFLLTRLLYLVMVFIVLKYLFMVLRLYRTKRENKRMGYE